MSGTVTVPASLLDDLAGLAENENHDELAAQARALLAEQKPTKPSLRERLGPWVDHQRWWDGDPGGARPAARVKASEECCCGRCKRWVVFGPGGGCVARGHALGLDDARLATTERRARKAADAALDKYIQRREKR